MTLEWIAGLAMIGLMSAWLYARSVLPQFICPETPLIPASDPGDLSPAVARLLMHGGYERGALTASLLALAGAGYLRIRRLGDKLFNIEVSSQGRGLPHARFAEENDVLNFLRTATRNGSSPFLIGPENKAQVKSMRARHKATMDDIHKNQLSTGGYGSGRLFRMLILLPVALAAIALFMHGFSFYALGAMGIFILLQATRWKSKTADKRPLLGLILVVFIWMALETYWSAPPALQTLGAPLLLVSLIILGGWLKRSYAARLKRRLSAEGCRLSAHAKALERFIRHTEISGAHALRQNPAQLQNLAPLLPYAAAFGLLPHWLELFPREPALAWAAGAGPSVEIHIGDDAAELGQFQADIDEALSDALDSASDDSSGDGDSSGGDGGGGGD